MTWEMGTEVKVLKRIKNSDSEEKRASKVENTRQLT
jgi:hypothetical protein